MSSKHENENTEFKLQLVDDLYRDIIAFANSKGGIVYIGIDDQGNVIGLENTDETYTRITNGIRDAIQPDITMFVKYTLQEDNVIRININEGTYKPYYLRSKGLKPSGVYIRQGASSAPASAEQIRQMIKVSDGDVFESMRSIKQDLTFNTASAAFKKYGVSFETNKYIALGIFSSENNIYTNLAWILSDQCMHTVKVAVYANESNTIFKDSKEFSGSIFKQLDDTFDYLMLCNRNISEFHGLERIDRQDYPEEALREALLNALIHRDYSFSGSIIINVNDRYMEFISIGGLLPGLSADDIRSGISQPRSRNLAEIFHRLKLIESYGTGIRKIFALYSECPEQPRIEVTPNTFKIILPNMNTARKIAAEYLAMSEKPPMSVYEKSNTMLYNSGYIEKIPIIRPQMQVILNYLEKHGEITNKVIQKLLNIKQTRVYVLMKQMRDIGLIKTVGRGEAKKYTRT